MLAPIAREMQLAMVAEASRAPSVHNVQPARWRFGADGWLTCFHELRRSLPEGDPTGRDIRLSIGAAVEGMAIAAGRLGFALDVQGWGAEGARAAGRAEPVLAPVGMRVAARLRIVPGGGSDPLAGAVDARQSWRGRFVAGAAGATMPGSVRHEDLIVIPRDHVDTVARWHDEATWHFERRRDYHAELWRWLRLSRGHPDWARDGLNGDALALSSVERTAAALLLRPPIFAMLSRLGIARALVAEGAVVRSAAALLVFAPPAAMDDWTIGRRFYRAWLEVTQAGLALAPMSALADWDVTRGRIADLARIPNDRRVVNVFRAGVAPPSRPPRSPRLPPGELLV